MRAGRRAALRDPCHHGVGPRRLVAAADNRVQQDLALHRAPEQLRHPDALADLGRAAALRHLGRHSDAVLRGREECPLRRRRPLQLGHALASVRHRGRPLQPRLEGRGSRERDARVLDCVARRVLVAELGIEEVLGAPLPQRHQREQHVLGHVCVLLHHGVEPRHQQGLYDVPPAQDRRVVVAGLPLPHGRVARDGGPARRRRHRPRALVRRHPRPRRGLVLVPPDRQAQYPHAALHPRARRAAPRRDVVVDDG
mmetsp:Transcript_76551/g.237034  ORF Transcript_76551/g.237034 Transcript_76551/m.237034 type:complete len:254 (+) Transcript_76551:152-913(+)